MCVAYDLFVCKRSQGIEVNDFVSLFVGKNNDSNLRSLAHSLVWANLRSISSVQSISCKCIISHLLSCYHHFISLELHPKVFSFHIIILGIVEHCLLQLSRCKVQAKLGHLTYHIVWLFGLDQADRGQIGGIDQSIWRLSLETRKSMVTGKFLQCIELKLTSHLYITIISCNDQQSSLVFRAPADTICESRHIVLWVLHNLGLQFIHYQSSILFPWAKRDQVRLQGSDWSGAAAIV